MSERELYPLFANDMKWTYANIVWGMYCDTVTETNNYLFWADFAGHGS